MADGSHVRKFGIYALDLRSHEFLKSGRRVKLQDQPFLVLAALLEHPGEVVTREELRRIVWPANTFVDFNNSLNIAVGKLRQVLHDDAGKPRYIETLPRLGYRFIAAVEEPEPATEPAASPIEAGLRPNRLAVGLILSGVLVWLVLWTSFTKPPPKPPGSITVRPSVAVIVRDMTGQPASGLGEQVAERLRNRLEDCGCMRTIPGEEVAQAARDLKLPVAASFSPKDLARIRSHTGADYLVVVSLVAGGRAGSVSLDLRLQDTKKGETKAAQPESGSRDDLPTLAALGGNFVLHSLGFASQSATHAAHDASPFTAGSAALYAGLEKLRNFDAQGARDLLERAVTMHPEDPSVHAALAQALDRLGYEADARGEARKAWNLSAGNTKRRLFFAAGYYEAIGEWDKAVDSYRDLIAGDPDSAAYWLRMARAQIKAGKPEAALATLDGLRKLPDARDAAAAAIDYAQSLAQEKLGKFDEAQRAAASAEREAETRRQLVPMADALALECRLFVQRGFQDSAKSACESASETYETAGDLNGAATSKAYLAWRIFLHGDTAKARGLYAEALEIHREIGNQAGSIWELNGLASVLRRGGDFTGARKSSEESLKIARLIRSRPDEADALENTGFAWMLEGNLAKAKDLFQEALGHFQEMHDQAGVGSVLNNLGDVLYLRGELQEAGKMLGQALQADRALDSPQDEADVLAWLGRVSLAQAQFAEAQRWLDESIRISSGTGIQAFAAECRLAKAESWLEMERPVEAEGSIRQEAEFFQNNGVASLELEARTILARALLDEGKTAEAGRELDRADGLHPANYGPEARFAFEIVHARVAAASGKPVDTARLIKTIDDAKNSGYLVYRLQAQLALGEIELKTGRAADARRVLDKLEKEAHARGFETIARKAQRLRPQDHGTGVARDVSILRTAAKIRSTA